MASCMFFWILEGLVSPGPSGLGKGRENSDLFKIKGKHNDARNLCERRYCN